MSPLLRSVRRSSFPRRRSPSRTFRTQWVGFGGGTGTLPQDTSITVQLIQNTGLQAMGLNQPTIIRIRGECYVQLQDPAGTPVQANPWIGLAIFDHEDAIVGGNPDDPFTESSKNIWMFHRSVYLTMASADDARAVHGGAVRLDVDIKSRRRFITGTTMAMVVANPPIASGGSVGVAFTGRALLHEFGR